VFGSWAFVFGGEAGELHHGDYELTGAAVELEDCPLIWVFGGEDGGEVGVGKCAALAGDEGDYCVPPVLTGV
jgi:hypothetical protein